VTATFATQIELDDRGMAWIAGTKVKVTEVVLDKIAYGSSPEEIHFQHPNLSLAQIHGALTYYYENQDKVDEQQEDCRSTPRYVGGSGAPRSVPVVPDQ
jgi:uncharacterized protein (DUF433 family)